MSGIGYRSLFFLNNS